MQIQERLHVAWKILCGHWQITKDGWHDAAQQQFENDYWIPLETQMQATQRETENLIQVIEQARRSVK